MSRNCKSKLTCEQCSKLHPTILHNPAFTRTVEKSEKETKTLRTKAVEKQVICPTIPVKIKIQNLDKVITVNCALDNCSTDCWLNESLLVELGLNLSPTTINLKTMAGKNTGATKVVNNLKVMDVNETNSVVIPVVYTKEENCWPFDKNDLVKESDVKKFKYLKDVPFKYVDADIGLLIGMNVPQLLKPLEIKGDKLNLPYASRHLLGWSFNGPIDKEKYSSLCNRTRSENIPNLSEEFERLVSNEFEDSSIGKTLSAKNKEWMSKAKANLQEINGRITMNLPLKENCQFPQNRTQVLHIFNSCLSRIRKDESLFSEYNNFMQEMITNKHAEKVPIDELESTGPCWYIPHHYVRHKTKKKLRIVFNCSRKCKGISLNDNLDPGPDLANSLAGVLMRFRQKPIAMMADIKQMFYQVRVPTCHADLMRFFWLDEYGKIAEFRLLVHVFGASSSPSIANFALKSCADNYLLSDEAKRIIEEDFYVDDLLTSFDDLETAERNMSEVVNALSKSNFSLKDFNSNNEALLEKFDSNKSLTASCIPSDEVLALGVTWNTKDKLNFTMKKKPKENITKRELLSFVAAVYDPIGAISPLLLAGRKIFQVACKLDIHWDDSLPEELQITWKKWIDEMMNLHTYKIERCLKLPIKTEKIDLHVFADGSEIGFGTVAYLKITYTNKEISTSLVASKSRLTPINNRTLKTIPRIELCAAKLAIELSKTIQKELTLDINTVTYWCDSTTVLNYIANEKLTFHRFVENKINFIRNFSSPKQWCYVQSKQNPADILSRGTNLELLRESDLWNQGPDFLLQENVNFDYDKKILSDDAEVKSKSVVTAVEKTFGPIEKLMNSCSTWYSLTIKVGWILKVKSFLKTKNENDKNFMIKDLRAAELAIFRYIQAQFYSDVIQKLSKGQTLTQKNFLRKLNPFLDKDGIIRIGGRISRSNMAYSVKHPILLPVCYLTELLVKDIHKKVGHMGRAAMLSEVRQRFWIVKARSLVQKVIHNCLICKKNYGKPSTALMSDLPERRMSSDKAPFTDTAVDFFGPFYVRHGRKEEKRYGVLFTCLTVRAVHVEIAHSLSTDSFIQALRRFQCRRGNIKSLTSDNATNFVGAYKEIKTAVENWNKTTIENWCKQNHIQWYFLPPYSSHFGGVYERQIKSIRKVFNAILYEQPLRITDESLSTFMCEAEAVINNRPLTEAIGDPEDLVALTPNNLLLFNAAVTFPPGLFKMEHSYLHRRWKQTQYLVELFWTRFKREYLTTLQERQKWNSKTRIHKVGDLVLVKDLNLPRNCWPLGRITETNVGEDGIVRSAKIRVAKHPYVKESSQFKVVERPIVKLVLLKPCEEL